jgi:DNA-binding LytR/AlgR family response regulator
MLTNFRAFLRQPFPYRISLVRILFSSAAIGLFVSLFLSIFKPFGSGDYILEGRTWVLWGYGFVTFLVLLADMLIGPIVFPGFFNETKWNLSRATGFQFWHIFSIGAANLIFAAFVGGKEIRLWAVPGFILQALAIGFFPLTISMFSIQAILLKKSVESTRRMNEHILASRSQSVEAVKNPTTVALSSESGKDHVEIRLQDLILIKSIDNYVEIYLADKDQVKMVMLRSSLTRIEQDVKDHLFLFKCHRAFLVNVNNISKVTGNSQGYQLVFNGIEFSVPVSRKTSKDLFERITRPQAGRASPRIH